MIRTSDARARAGKECGEGRLGAWRPRSVIVWAFLGLAALQPALAADPSIRVEIDRARIATGGQAVLTVSLDGLSSGSKRPEVPPVDGLEFIETGRSSSISWVNGKLSTATIFTYLVVAQRPGSYRIGPVSVEDRGTRYDGGSVALAVVAGAPDAAGDAAPGGAPSGAARAPGREEAQAEEGGIFARVEVEPREAFVDQQVTVRFRLYQREDVQLMDLGEFQAPSAEGFWRESLGPQRDYRVTIDGARYLVREMAWAFFPTRSGVLEIGPARITAYLPERSRRQRGVFPDFFGQGLMHGRPVPLATAPSRVRVSPLPEGGRPEGFTGSVGDYAISARWDAGARQGEPFTLQVTVRGRGHIETIGAPEWPVWDGLRVYDSGEAVTSAPADEEIAGEKVFTRVLVPSRAGRLTGEPVRFTYFDPQRRAYRTVETEPFALEVAPGGGTPGGGDGTVLPLGEDILYIQTGIAGTLERVSGGGLSWGWGVHLFVLALLGAAGIVRRRRLAVARDPVLARRSRACREALRTLGAGAGRDAGGVAVAAAVADALERYLSDWLDLPVRGTRRAELQGALRGAGLTEGLVTRVRALLDWCEEARYGAGAAGGEANARTAEARDLLSDLERAFRAAGAARRSRPTISSALPVVLLLLLATARAGLAAVPQAVVEAVQQGERAYGEGRFEDALDAYRRALAGGWASPALYYNLGCSAYKAGETGWAVAYFEEARRLAPRNAEIRHNARMAAARVQDRPPAGEGSWMLGALSSFLDGYTPADGVRALLVLLWCGALALAGCWLLAGRARKAAMRALAGTGLVLALVLAGIALKAYQVRSGPSGVVVAREVSVRAGPRDEETVRFALHAGAQLHVGRNAGPWREVWLTEEMRGWAPADAVATLRPARWLP